MSSLETAVHPPTLSRIPPGRLALWLVIVSEVVMFGGLMAVYLLNRLRHPEWGALAEHTSTPLGALNTVILLTSSFTAVLAHQAAHAGDFRKASNLLLATVSGGAGFLVVKSFEYAHEIHNGFTITAGPFWSYYYVMTGLHAFHVIVGMIALFAVSRLVRRGLHPEAVEMAGLYWHFVDVVWIFLFPLLYIAH